MVGKCREGHQVLGKEGGFILLISFHQVFSLSGSTVIFIGVRRGSFLV